MQLANLHVCSDPERAVIEGPHWATPQGSSLKKSKTFSAKANEAAARGEADSPDNGVDHRLINQTLLDEIQDTEEHAAEKLVEVSQPEYLLN